MEERWGLTGQWNQVWVIKFTDTESRRVLGADGGEDRELLINGYKRFSLEG